MSRFLTTKFPLCVVLIQLAWILHSQDLELRLDWLPRLQNREADALTNGDYSGFNPDLRVDIRPDHLLQGHFQELLSSKGSELYQEVRELRAKRKGGLVKPAAAGKKARGSGLIGPW